MATVEKDLGLVVGSTGPAGKDAKISSATGRITPGHKSVPTVSVVVGGETGSQTLDFTFDGIQGEEGSDANVPIATTGEAGKVKPDGTSITIDSSGTIKVGQVAATSLTGTVPLSNLPQGALERVVTVADETARFKLTTSSVQLGDIVQQLDNKVMYVVVDESKLTEADGYKEFTAATATKALESDNATNSDHAGYLNYHVVDDGVDLNTLRGIGKAGIYYKSSDNTTVVNVPANVDPAMEAILEVIPLNLEGITEQRYTTMGLQERVHLYVRHTDAQGSWQGWVTIGPQAAVGEASHAENADNAHLANVANQLGSVNVGTINRPIYLDQGNPKPLSGSAGDFENPIYLNEGSFDVVSKVANASHADEADHTPLADKATTASQADEATHADNADNATSAGKADIADNLSSILSVDHGGTGQGNLTDAANSLINSLTEEVGNPTDNDYFLSQSAGEDKYHRRRFSNLWNWIDEHMGDIEIDTARFADSATSAEHLSVSEVGNAFTPVYFSGGVPVEVQKVSEASNADHANAADKSTEANHAASADEAISAVHATNADNSGVADMVGSQSVGNATTPIYLDNGSPTTADPYPDLTPYLKSADLVKNLKTSIDSLPEREIVEDDYVIVQSQGGETSRAKLGVSTSEEFGLVTTEDIATASKVGLVKPDGTTIKVTTDGTISVDKVDTSTLVTKSEFVQMLKDNIEEIRTALGLATSEHMGLVPPLPSAE